MRLAADAFAPQLPKMRVDWLKNEADAPQSQRIQVYRSLGNKVEATNSFRNEGECRWLRSAMRMATACYSLGSGVGRRSNRSRNSIDAVEFS